MGVARALLNFIYPPRCGVCSSFMDEHVPVCGECESGMPAVNHPLCVVCGVPFNGGVDHPCGSCLGKRPPFDRARSAGIHAGTLRPAIINFKFGGRVALAKPLGMMMADTLLAEFDPHLIDTIIPVPLHKKRLRWRGFNQALLLARELSAVTGLWVDPFSLKRVRETRPQTRLPFKERRENVKGAFDVSRETFVKDRAVLLVDDVYTTGSTLAECAKVLKAAGAGRVEVLTAARAVQDF